MSGTSMSGVVAKLRGAERRTVITSVVVIVVLVVGLGLWWWREHRSGIEFRADFTTATGIYPGNGVRILDVQVGKIDSVTPNGRDVTLTMTLDPGISVRADTWAVIVAPNLVSDRYVELTGAYVSGPKLASGSMIPLARTRTPVELDALYRSLISLNTALGPNGANKQGSLSQLLRVGAANLGGNGARISRTIGDLSRSSSTLAGSRKNIFATIDQLSQFTRTLANHNSQLAGANNDLAAVTRTLSDDRDQYGQALQDLGGALLLVKQFVQQHRAALSANIHRLSRAAASLSTRQASLAQALRSAPLLLQNFLNAYDPRTNLLRGRTDLNELTVWANEHANSAATQDSAATHDSTATQDSTTSTAAGTSQTAATSGASSTPSGLLPSVGSVQDVP